MLSKTFSYPSNNRAFMEMANLEFWSYFPPATLLSSHPESPALRILLCWAEPCGERGPCFVEGAPQARMTGLPVVWEEHIWPVEGNQGQGQEHESQPSFERRPSLCSWVLACGLFFPRFLVGGALREHRDKWPLFVKCPWATKAYSRATES